MTVPHLPADPLPGPVVHVIAPAAFGGAESVILHLCEASRSLGIDARVAVLGGVGSDHPWVRLLESRGVPVHIGPEGPRAKWTEWAWLSRLVQAHRVAVLHSHGYRADFAVMRTSTGAWKWVSTVHGFTAANWRVRVFERLGMQVLRRAHAVACVSTRLQQTLSSAGVSVARLHLLRNTPRPVIPWSRERARDALKIVGDEPVLGWVGRFSKEKGPDRLPSIISLVEQPCQVALIGDGPLRESTMQQLQASRWSASWYAPRPDVASLMPALDLLVLTSRTEGMPMVVLEAMAAGVPVVAFEVGDVHHAVTATTGWLVAQDDVPAFANAVNVALAHPSERERRSRAAMQLIDACFSGSAWAREHLTLYRRLHALGERHSSSHGGATG